jgi:hypothetical protein
MREACTIKVREYLRAGLPVYSGHSDVFPPSFPFFKEGPCSVDSIMAFAEKNEGVARADVSEAARPYIEKDRLVEGLYDDICQNLFKA